MSILDNPIWHALNGPQASLAEADGGARRFPTAITPLGGFEAPRPAAFADLARLQRGHEATALFLTEFVEPPPGWRVLAREILPQMVLDGIELPAPILEIAELDGGASAAMQELTKLTKPGPFGPRTHELGNYVGIWRDGRLAAMAGERLHPPGFTEVSAVCTHPDFTGQGLGAALVAAVARRILARGEIPMLHVRADNARAIALYERLGFRERTRLHLLVVRKSA